MNVKNWRISNILCLLLVLLTLSGCGANPESTADKFMSLLVKGQHLAAQEMLGKDMKSMAAMLGGISNETLNPYYRSGSFTSYKLELLEKTSSSVRYKVIATTRDGVMHNDFIDLAKEEDDWRVSRF